MENIKICLDKKKFYKLFKDLFIPIPITEQVESKEKLFKIFLNKKNNINWYLKSDFGKSPNYIYKINKKNYSTTNIFWGKDRYLRDSYLLQEEFLGEHLRINIIRESYCIFKHSNNSILTSEKILKNIFKKNVLQELQKLVCYLGFLNFICKFDIIINEHNWVLLDIGIDPPSRMLKLYLDKNINFYNLYVKQFFGQKVYFPFTNQI